MMWYHLTAFAYVIGAWLVYVLVRGCLLWLADARHRVRHFGRKPPRSGGLRARELTR